MFKPKLVVYSPEPPRCTCFHQIFNAVFECHTAVSSASFKTKIKTIDADAAVVCLCSAPTEQASELLSLAAVCGTIPAVACSKFFTPDFVQQAAQQGIDRFVLCDTAPEKIRELILEAIRHGGVKAFVESCYPDSLVSSPYARKMIDEIVRAFPRRMSENEIARRLGISPSWLQKLWRRIFNCTFKRFLRRIWVYQALRLMWHTALDNGEIALQLNYSEASNLARDFRKELKCTPSEARIRLNTQKPEEMLR